MGSDIRVPGSGRSITNKLYTFKISQTACWTGPPNPRSNNMDGWYYFNLNLNAFIEWYVWHVEIILYLKKQDYYFNYPIIM